MCREAGRQGGGWLSHQSVHNCVEVAPSLPNNPDVARVYPLLPHEKPHKPDQTFVELQQSSAGPARQCTLPFRLMSSVPYVVQNQAGQKKMEPGHPLE